MASFIEDYALLSDMNTGALVSRTGSIDWFCAPRFDSRAVFAALLGEREHGRWLLAPLESVNPAPVEEIRTERSYRENTFILQTVWFVGDASVRVTEFMPLSGGTTIVRNVEGLTGEVTMYHELALRFDYGKTIPWVTRYEGVDAAGTPDSSADMLVGMAGPHALVFRGDSLPEGDPESKAETFTVSAGQSYTFTLSYFASNHNPPAPVDYPTALTYTQEQWQEWSDLYSPADSLPEAEGQDAAPAHLPEGGQVPTGVRTSEQAEQAPATISAVREVETKTSSILLETGSNTSAPEVDEATYHELAQTAASQVVAPSAEDHREEANARYREARLRSLLVLRALISRETGALVASVTTSLPEVIGGKRNYDFRFTWLRDVAMAMDVTLTHGHERETAQLRNWILRALANNPRRIHAVYGLAGEKDDIERRLALPGYEGSQPVRSGNGSGDQFQGDALGQVLVTFANLREAGVAEDHLSWPIQKALLNAATERIGGTDRSMWETFGEPAIYTHSQAMLWAAFDAGVSAVRDFGLDGDAATWEHCRDAVADEILSRGFNADLGCFVSTYGGTAVDASLLQLPQIGLVDWDDPRMLATVERIEATIRHSSGMIYRYDNSDSQDGFEGQDNPHFISSLWLAEQYIRSGREADGRALLDTVLDCANDLGLMSSEYDFEQQRLTGNFPQALAHISLIRAVEALGL
ncbi:glycoside hydrolase family 15 protein [Rothia sp. SD9660Na]|uniref:glycoside hydrolase family 15 protein n=1 Tax=Rothia sp. SD9660Na TaxID=3047030 RepID=UPI0024BBDA9E|nr:glycoside hydrolase family 15 protein [Rothia sp. SD9660Na]WHS50542.1 glycoside hydrolase family 15 protein [Rothia sp. SD9660Na]